MALLILAQQREILPEPFWFLGWGWWIWHLIVIPLVFWLGMLLQKRRDIKHPPEHRTHRHAPPAGV